MKKNSFLYKIFYKIEDISNYFKSLINIKKKYKIGKISILLPSNHLLPRYQYIHKKYDKFLPYLVQNFEKDSTIVDVGANVGDTFSAMVQNNPFLKFICIEGDKQFFKLLEKNVNTIKKEYNCDVTLINSLIGKNISCLELKGKNGSKNAILSENNRLFTITLDEIVENSQIKNIQLIKIDVDGFDYDVIESSINIIAKFKPIIFLECQIDFEYQKVGFLNVFEKLKKFEYTNILIFDNLGNLITQTNNFSILYHMINYIYNQKRVGGIVTIPYYDILVNVDCHSKQINEIVSKYNMVEFV